MSYSKKMKVDAIEMAKQIAKELMAQQTKFFQDEMENMQDEMSKMKEELSKKVEDAISGKNEATKDNASDVGAANDNVQGKGVYSSIGFDYGQLIKVHLCISPSSTMASHLTSMEQDIPIGPTR